MGGVLPQHRDDIVEVGRAQLAVAEPDRVQQVGVVITSWTPKFRVSRAVPEGKVGAGEKEDRPRCGMGVEVVGGPDGIRRHDVDFLLPGERGQEHGDQSAGHDADRWHLAQAPSAVGGFEGEGAENGCERQGEQHDPQRRLAAVVLGEHDPYGDHREHQRDPDRAFPPAQATPGADDGQQAHGGRECVPGVRIEDFSGLGGELVDVRVRGVGNRVRSGEQAEIVLDVTEVRREPGQGESGQHKCQPPWPEVSRDTQCAHSGDNQVRSELVADDHRCL